MNGDGSVDSADTTAIMTAIGYEADLDVNMDGAVDTKDSSAVSKLSGRTLSAGQLSDSGNIVGWCGYLYEESTGMWLARHRWQIPELGRWANRDPIGYAGGSQNLYEYVNGNPVFLSDPSGLKPPEEDLKYRKPNGEFRFGPIYDLDGSHIENIVPEECIYENDPAYQSAIDRYNELVALRNRIRDDGFTTEEKIVLTYGMTTYEEIIKSPLTLKKEIAKKLPIAGPLVSAFFAVHGIGMRSTQDNPVGDGSMGLSFELIAGVAANTTAGAILGVRVVGGFNAAARFIWKRPMGGKATLIASVAVGGAAALTLNNLTYYRTAVEQKLDFMIQEAKFEITQVKFRIAQGNERVRVRDGKPCGCPSEEGGEVPAEQ